MEGESDDVCKARGCASQWVVDSSLDRSRMWSWPMFTVGFAGVIYHSIKSPWRQSIHFSGRDREREAFTFSSHSLVFRKEWAHPGGFSTKPRKRAKFAWLCKTSTSVLSTDERSPSVLCTEERSRFRTEIVNLCVQHDCLETQSAWCFALCFFQEKFAGVYWRHS